MKMTDIDKYKTLKTPCFIFDEGEFTRSVRQFYDALESNFKKSIIGYSVKTNSLPYILKKALDLGCYAEVVSHDEYQLARLVGFSIDRIIYNGPMKSKETFLEAIMGNAIVNIETKRELEWLKELPSSGDYGVGIRLNIDINAISPDDTKKADDFSRFGFSDATGEFDDALRAISRVDNVKLKCLHIHRMSSTRSVAYYKHLVDYACGIIKKNDLSVEMIDIGGGYFGIFKNAPTYKDYSDAFKESIANNFQDRDFTVIVEPGTAVVASSMSYMSTVIDTKTLPGHRIVVTDGSRNDVDPLFTKTDYIKEILHQGNTPMSDYPQVVCGSSCIERDHLFILNDCHALLVGDMIRYKNVGSYTMCLSPNFINYLPRIYVEDDGGCYRLIRDKWTVKEYIQKSVW